MFPFRELEIHDHFVLDGEKCEKIESTKYLIISESGKKLETISNPNILVTFLEKLAEEKEEYDEDYLHWYFFSTLLTLVNAIEDSGKKTIKVQDLKSLAEFSLELDQQDEPS